MSKKSTKIIAVAGVVAGLGVAALPAMTFAAQSVKGQVNVEAEVLSAIAMTIEGNDDTGTHTGVSTFTPSNAAYIGNYDTSTGTAYSSSALQTSGSRTTILPNAEVEGAWGADENNFGSLITVYTNDADGYNLTVADQDTNTSLVKGTGAGAPEIAALDATTNPFGAGHSAWGYKVSGGSSWLAMPGSGDTPALIKNGSAVAAGDTSTVLYAVSTSATQATGVYNDTIVYTATTTN
ncbi:hypothetical protein IKE07_00800 [Candidatus Saccharibacteria bacterium]|nr:hypothetical protein [Candidatus Saccharibacteria bacterium]